MSDGHQFEISQITDLIFIGSDLCRGMVCPIHGPEFESLGICGEVNLEVEHPETPPPQLDAYLWLPVEDKQAPRPDQLIVGTSFIHEMVKLNNKVYVHCKNGHGRSPTLVIAYLMKYDNKTLDQALELVRQKRPEVHLEETQLQALKAWK